MVPVCLVFLAPGKFKLWVDYYFPSDLTKAVEYSRQRNNAVFVFLYSCKFWLMITTLLTILPGVIFIFIVYYFNINQTPGYAMPPDLAIRAARFLARFWLVRESAMLDAHLFATGIHNILAFFHWINKPAYS
jgi:hypothetical protein